MSVNDQLRTSKVAVGKAFPAGDEAANWMLALIVAVNDVNYVNHLLIEKMLNGSEAFENLYLFRLAVSHLREALQLFVGKRRSIPEKVRHMLDQDLSVEGKRQLDLLLKETGQDGTFLHTVLGNW